MKYYIAYGSNLDKRHFERLCPGAIAVTSGILRGWHMVFRGSDGFSYATVEPCEGCEVPVGVWSIDESFEPEVDSYEGYPDLYGKRVIDVETPLGMISGMIYIMSEGYGLARPDESYIRTVERGYHDFGLDDAVLSGALEYGTGNIEE